MRYEFGFLDFLQFFIYDTAIDCVPHLDLRMKQPIDPEKLKKAVRGAINEHKIFGTKLVYDHDYYLEDNEQELVILNTANPPKDFGRTTNGYMWRVSYWEDTLFFDFSHGLTDGHGFVTFVTTILELYCGLPISCHAEPYFDPYKKFYDKSVKPFGMRKMEKGFSTSTLPHITTRGSSPMNIVSVNVTDLLHISKKAETSLVALLLPLFSKAIRECLPTDAKNRNICCGFPIDFRAPMKMYCGRNFVGMRNITYTDRFDKYDLETLGTVYRGIMDLSVQPENVISYVTDTYNQLSFIRKLKPRFMARAMIKMAGTVTKSSINCFITYLGRLPFSPELSQQIDDVSVKMWSDTGYCSMTAYDFDGTLRMSICNSYKTDKIVPNFMKTLEEYGVHSNCTKTETFTQAHFLP